MQARAKTPPDRMAMLRISKCSIDAACKRIYHEIGDWAFSVPRRFAPSTLGAAREYCSHCNRPDSKAFWVPSRVEDFLLARMTRAALKSKLPGVSHLPELQPMPALVLRDRSEDMKRQLRTCNLVAAATGRFTSKINGTGLRCARHLRASCWGDKPVTVDSYQAQLTDAKLFGM